MKEHISRLPIVDYEQIVSGYNFDKSSIAISIPLFYSSFQWVKGGIATARFKNIHCKGAIWTAISFLKNTDLGDNGVPIYFHIEDKMYSKAMSVFKQFNVPDKYIRKMDFEKGKFAKPAGIKNVHYGKKFFCLLDKDLPTKNIKNWIITDSDFFACSPTDIITLYDVLNSDHVRANPSSISYKLNRYDTKEWLERISDAAGIKYTPDIKENDILKRFGLKPLKPITRETVIRPKIETTLVSIPIDHAVTHFIKKHMWKCCEDQFLLLCYSLYCPFIDLADFIYAPIITSVHGYIGKHLDSYFNHLIYDSFNPDAYFTKFYRDLTARVDIRNLYMDDFKNFHGDM